MALPIIPEASSSANSHAPKHPLLPALNHLNASAQLLSSISPLLSSHVYSSLNSLAESRELLLSQQTTRSYCQFCSSPFIPGWSGNVRTSGSQSRQAKKPSRCLKKDIKRSRLKASEVGYGENCNPTEVSQRNGNGQQSYARFTKTNSHDNTPGGSTVSSAAAAQSEIGKSQTKSLGQNADFHNVKRSRRACQPPTPHSSTSKHISYRCKFCACSTDLILPPPPPKNRIGRTARHPKVNTLVSSTGASDSEHSATPAGSVGESEVKTIKGSTAVSASSSSKARAKKRKQGGLLAEVREMKKRRENNGGGSGNRMGGGSTLLGLMDLMKADS